MLARLDKHSRSFLAALAERHPEWVSYARVDTDEWNTRPYVVIEVPAPTGADLAHILTITTDNDEVTVAMDHYHSHFAWPTAYESLGNPYTDALEFIDRLAREEIAVWSEWDGAAWHGSSCGGPDDLTNAFNKSLLTFRARSWKGSLNRDKQL
jgi:hypothetical protein